MKKIISVKKLSELIEGFKDNNRVVYMSGVFDLFHYGHYSALQRASRLGDILIVQVDSNSLVRSRKGLDRPYLDERVRARIVASLDFVNYVFISKKPSINSKKLRIINPNVFVRAIKDTESDEDRKVIELKIKSMSPQTRINWMDQTPWISTSKIISIFKVDGSLRPPLVK